jgi:hypothetical protein
MADLSDVDTLVTDSGLPEEARRQVRSQIGEVIFATVPPTPEISRVASFDTF